MPCAQVPFQCVGKLYAAAHHNHVDIVRRSFKKQVADISADNITFEVKRIGGRRNLMEYIFIKQACHSAFVSNFIIKKFLSGCKITKNNDTTAVFMLFIILCPDDTITQNMIKQSVKRLKLKQPTTGIEIFFINLLIL